MSQVKKPEEAEASADGLRKPLLDRHRRGHFLPLAPISVRFDADGSPPASLLQLSPENLPKSGHDEY